MLTFDLRPLMAAAVCAGTEETRYYLNGVYLEVTPFHMVFVGTDGHRLAALRTFVQWDKEPDAHDFNIIIPLSVIKKIKYPKRDPKACLKKITLPDGGEGYLIKRLGEPDADGITFSPLEATYPDWRRVVPSEASNSGGIEIQFNPRYLHEFLKIGKIFGQETEFLSVVKNGSGPAPVSIWPDLEIVSELNLEYALVIMPFRSPIDKTWEKPEWSK